MNFIYGHNRRYRYFLNFDPVAMAGYSIYIYHITLDEANRVRRGLGLKELQAKGGSEKAGANRKNLKWLDLLLDDPQNIDKYRFFILAPQCPAEFGFWTHGATARADDMATVIVAILQNTMRDYLVDPNRVYLAGVSSGGDGCWEMAMHYPELFAAVVPMGSGGSDISRAAALGNVPIWAFHNRDDLLCSPAHVEDMVAAVKLAGGNAHLSLLKATWWSHDCWTEAFQKHHIMAWMLAQDRSAWICWNPPGGTRWHWWHVLTVLGPLLAAAWLGWRWERRRRNRKAVQNNDLAKPAPVILSAAKELAGTQGEDSSLRSE